MTHIQTNFTAEAMNTGKKAAVVAPVKVEPKKKVKPEPVAEVVVETPVVEEVVVVEETPVVEETVVVEEAPLAE
jgi:hypothetical protein